jgi:hypothetical protein
MRSRETGVGMVVCVEYILCIGYVFCVAVINYYIIF